MERYCSAATEEAAAYTAQFYDEARALSSTDGAYSAEAVPGRVPDATDGAVRGIVQTIVDGGAWSTFSRLLLDRADYEIKCAANRCAIANADRDPAKPRWARVPTGSETCGFCIMLASRGYDYLRKESADHAHPNCDCRVVPQFGEGSIEGYDPSYYDELYRRNVVADDVGTVNVKATANAIQRYVSNGGCEVSVMGKASGGALDYSLLTGKQLRRLTKNEKEGHDALRGVGLAVKVLPTDRSAVASIDLMIGDDLWELKTPEKTGGRIRTRINEGVSKWDRLHEAGLAIGSNPKIVLDNRFCSMSDKDALAALVECMGYHREKGFDEAIFICKSGRVKHIER